MVNTGVMWSNRGDVVNTGVVWSTQEWCGQHRGDVVKQG